MKQKRKKSNGPKRHMLLLSVFTVAVVTLIFTVPTVSAGHHHRHPRACSKTASAAFFACQNEVKDDYWIAKGNCYNATEDQAECFAEAKEDYKDAREECGDQLEARKDLCEDLGEAPYDPEIDPDDFINPADIGGDVDPNPYFPLVTGNTWEYQGGDETTTVEVTDEIIEILGVPCVVVTDVVEEDGEEIEVTQDWFAQDEEGNVWYMGESSLGKVECDDEDDPDVCEGLVTEEGSWKAGFEYAKPGILVKSHPEMDDIYRQEFALGDAEDWAKVLSVEASETTPAESCSDDCLQTGEGTPLESADIIEDKYYKPNVGLILEVDRETGQRVELICGPSSCP